MEKDMVLLKKRCYYEKTMEYTENCGKKTSWWIT